MGLDLTITSRRQIICPKCGEIVAHTDISSVDSGGRMWYDILETFGYYVPYDQRTEENDWYSKDMTLTEEQARELYCFANREGVYNGSQIVDLVALAAYEHDDIVINANW